jgi:hypothetical protein
VSFCMSRGEPLDIPRPRPHHKLHRIQRRAIYVRIVSTRHRSQVSYTLRDRVFKEANRGNSSHALHAKAPKHHENSGYGLVSLIEPLKISDLMNVKCGPYFSDFSNLHHLATQFFLLHSVTFLDPKIRQSILRGGVQAMLSQNNVAVSRSANPVCAVHKILRSAQIWCGMRTSKKQRPHIIFRRLSL